MNRHPSASTAGVHDFHPTIMRDHIKLFIPGPIEVSADTFQAMTQPMIGHRSGDFAKLYERMMPMLQSMFGTERPVFLSTSSAWGVMEASIRNLTQKKVLNCCCGAFSDKWFDVAKRNGLDADQLQVEWGQPILADALREKLSSGEYDVVTLVHNETSTGVMNPLAELAAVVNEFNDVLLIVDTVSSFSTVPTEMDALGIDVLLTGTQKALALPPGLGLFAVSQRAMDRAATTPNRGYYFDFFEFEANAAKFMTPSTPCISLLYGLEHQLNKIFAEGLDARFARHAKLNSMIHAWGEKHAIKHFAPEGYRSMSLTTFENTEDFDLDVWNKDLKANHKLMINMGYGKIKGKTFRISNMGDESEETIAELIDALDATFPGK